ncbi:MAG: formylglycine-generating enzyme family protein [Planctomycetota bacterium]|nr:formylglycine-generating enzyme family protein [Planctomycetota bacterium]
MNRKSIVGMFSACAIVLCWIAFHQAKVSAAGSASAPATGPAGPLTLEVGKGVRMTLALIPAGQFTMGSPEGEKNRQGNEGPQHEVTISKPFYVGICEVTQEQYQAVMGKNPSFFKGAKNPVENVTWDNAVEFCKKLSEKTGKTVTLPTEAQWEYACRAGSKTAFHYGDDADNAGLGDHAWYVENCKDTTHPVGGKKPNAWGLYDMHGNVWEWCSDWESPSYAGAGATDPQGPDRGVSRILRGGGWSLAAKYCRSAERVGCEPGQRSNIFGFRVVVESK